MIPRYTTPEMGRIWSDENRFATWLKVELAVCEVQAELGEIPKESLKVILEKADFDAKRVDEIELTTRHDVIAFLTNVAEYVGPDSRFIHMGMTSSDLLDTALALQCVEAGQQIMARLEKFHETLRAKALEHKYTWQIGRSHGIHAEPITFGVKIAMWSEEIGRDITRCKAAFDGIAVGQVSGAVGTFAHLPMTVEEETCKRLGLKAASVTSQIIQRDRHAEYLNAIAITGATIEKIALEIRHLQRTEVREVEEPFRKGQKGSSAMPHKRNPIVTEQMCGLARLLRTNALAGLENVALWHERDISHSSVERVILPDSTTLLDHMLKKMQVVMEDLLIYPEAMLKNLNMTGGLIFSQQVLLAFVKNGVTREDAYGMVQRNAMKVWEEGGDFLSLLKEDPEITAVLSHEVIDNCFNYDNLRESINGIFARIKLG